MATKTAKTSVLPKGILKSDTVCPKWNSKTQMARENGEKYGATLQFDLWYVEGSVVDGWCIPTLMISKSRRASQSYSGGERTYAVRVSDGTTVRIGNGPHVKERHTVYVKASRLKTLQKFLDMQKGGAEDANQIRDRISTRRAAGALRRWY